MLQFRQWSVYEGDLHSSCWLSPLLTWLMVQEFCALHFLCFFAQTKHISRSVTSLSSKNDVTVTTFQSYQECVLTWPLKWWWSKDSHCMCDCNPYGKAQEALAVQWVGTTQIDTLLLTVSIIYSQSLFVFNQVRSPGDAHPHHQLTQVMSSSSGVISSSSGVISSSSVKQSSSSGKLPSRLGGRTVILLWCGICSLITGTL